MLIWGGLKKNYSKSEPSVLFSILLFPTVSPNFLWEFKVLSGYCISFPSFLWSVLQYTKWRLSRTDGETTLRLIILIFGGVFCFLFVFFFFCLQDSVSGWRNVFFLAAAVNMFGLVFYLTFGQAEIQHWAKERTLTRLWGYSCKLKCSTLH